MLVPLRAPGDDPALLTYPVGVAIVHLTYGPRQTLDGTHGKDSEPL
jgi:hypothetical protein